MIEIGIDGVRTIQLGSPGVRVGLHVRVRVRVRVCMGVCVCVCLAQGTAAEIMILLRVAIVHTAWLSFGL